MDCKVSESRGIFSDIVTARKFLTNFEQLSRTDCRKRRRGGNAKNRAEAADFDLFRFWTAMIPFVPGNWKFGSPLRSGTSFDRWSFTGDQSSFSPRHRMRERLADYSTSDENQRSTVERGRRCWPNEKNMIELCVWKGEDLSMDADAWLISRSMSCESFDQEATFRGWDMDLFIACQVSNHFVVFLKLKQKFSNENWFVFLSLFWKEELFSTNFYETYISVNIWRFYQ